MQFKAGFGWALLILSSTLTLYGAHPALTSHRPLALQNVTAVGALDETNQIALSIGLPLRDPELLDQLLAQIYDPASPLYRHYLTPDQFNERFAPSHEDYQQLIAFAQNSGFRVTAIHPNRTLLGVTASTRQVQRTFSLKMRSYRHPREARLFFANDSEPTIQTPLPILHISGLNNFTLPHPMNLHSASALSAFAAGSRAGSGTGGSYLGADFRKAYAPGITLTGAGQRVGLFELNGYYPTDIAAYTNLAGFVGVPLQNVLIGGFNGSPGVRRPGSPNEEVALDIEVAMAMAPGLEAIVVYEGSPSSTTATINDVLNRMATDNLASQLSCSWGFDIDANTQQIFKQYAAQGQSFYLASGDSGAFPGVVEQPSDNPFVTVVGGTELSTDSSHRWLAETVWAGSSGGISTVYPIPSWQQNIDVNATNGASATLRNTPDVAMVANDVLVVADRGRTLSLAGTSIAAPLWAGFTALINEQAASEDKPPVGFINPALYALAQTAGYTNAFHDVTVGNNTNKASFRRYVATPGYDLCTGLGTPNGTNFISALLNLPAEPLRIESPLGFTSHGPIGGPFTVTTQTYTLTNLSSAPLAWSLVNTSSWLSVSAANGTLLPGQSTNVAIALNAAAANLLIGDYNATVTFQSDGSNSSQTRHFLLHVGNGGFETGDLSEWTLSGDQDVNFADSLDADLYAGQSIIPNISDSQFVHAGLYGAFLGQPDTLGTLSQMLPTIPGAQYLISFWFAAPAEGAPNEFIVQWNTATLLDEVDLPITAWTNYQFTVSAEGASSLLQFSFRNDQNAFALDDVSVRSQAAAVPALVSVAASAGVLHLDWSTVPGHQYQLQYTASLDSPEWLSLDAPVTAAATTTAFTDPIDPARSMRFYRLVEL